MTPPHRELENADVVTSSDDYASRFRGPVGAWFLDVQARLVQDLLSHLPTGSTIVDVGGGHGQVTPALIERGYRVLVLGSSPACGTRLQPWLDGNRCRFEVANLQALPYDGSTFDAAICLRLLPHSVRWTTLLAELCRVSRTSVIVDYPSTRSVNLVANQFFGLKRRVEGNTRAFRLFHPRQIRREFRTHGFMVAAERPQFLLPMVLHRKADVVKMSRFLEASGRVLGLTRWLGSPILARADRAGP